MLWCGMESRVLRVGVVEPRRDEQRVQRLANTSRDEQPRAQQAQIRGVLGRASGRLSWLVYCSPVQAGAREGMTGWVARWWWSRDERQAQMRHVCATSARLYVAGMGASTSLCHRAAWMSMARRT